MALIITPGQLARRAEFYHQLAQLNTVGLGIVTSLEQLHARPPGRSYRKPIARAIQHVNDGYTLTESFQRTPNWLPSFDIAILSAGETAGRLDASLRLLAKYYEERGRMANQLVSSLAYPVFLFHFAAIIFPFPQLFLTGDWLPFLKAVGYTIMPAYALAVILVYAMQSRHNETWRGIVESVLHPIPVLGTARRSLALARLSAALEGLISAGVTIVEAWEMAAAASGSPALRRAVISWRPLLSSGQTTSDAVSAAGAFPALFASQYAAGEISGRLDETLRRLQEYYQDEGMRKLKAFTRFATLAIYLFIMFRIAYQIISFYAGYFGEIQKVIGDGGM